MSIRVSCLAAGQKKMHSGGCYMCINICIIVYVYTRDVSKV